MIGGGDWADDRIVPDAMRALAADQPIHVRSPQSTRPWQHVLEPLSGYLLLAERLSDHGPGHPYTSAFNFGSTLDSNRSVKDLVETILQNWPGVWLNLSDLSAPHEAGRLHLQIDGSPSALLASALGFFYYRCTHRCLVSVRSCWCQYLGMLFYGLRGLSAGFNSCLLNFNKQRSMACLSW